MFLKIDIVYLRMVLVESIPEQMRYKGNVTLGLPLEKAWKTLISMATEQVDLVSFYWTLTGEDISVNSSSDQLVRVSTNTPPNKHINRVDMSECLSCGCIRVYVCVCVCVSLCVHCREETSWKDLRSCPPGTSVSEHWPVFPV